MNVLCPLHSVLLLIMCHDQVHVFTAPVENVSVSINSATSVSVSWNVTDELLGWSSFYFIVYYSAHLSDEHNSISHKFEVSNTYLNIEISDLVLEGDWQHKFEVSTVLVVDVEGIDMLESEKTGVTVKFDLGMVVRLYKLCK